MWNNLQFDILCKRQYLVIYFEALHVYVSDPKSGLYCPLEVTGIIQAMVFDFRSYFVGATFFACLKRIDAQGDNRDLFTRKLVEGQLVLELLNYDFSFSKKALCVCIYSICTYYIPLYICIYINKGRRYSQQYNKLFGLHVANLVLITSIQIVS